MRDRKVRGEQSRGSVQAVPVMGTWVSVPWGPVRAPPSDPRPRKPGQPGLPLSTGKSHVKGGHAHRGLGRKGNPASQGPWGPHTQAFPFGFQINVLAPRSTQ